MRKSTNWFAISFANVYNDADGEPLDADLADRLAKEYVRGFASASSMNSAVEVLYYGAIERQRRKAEAVHAAFTEVAVHLPGRRVLTTLDAVMDGSWAEQ